MSKFRTGQIRNVAVLGHSGSGKTSLTEALLFKSGVTSRAGRVEDGTTASDWDPEEQRRGISINLSIVPVEFEETKVNFIDAPGYLDFVGEVISALHVAESGLLLVDAVAGAEVGTELAWDRLVELEKPRLIFMNKMDRENANFQRAIESLRKTLGEDSTILPFQLPIGEAENFKGVVNLANMKAYMGPNNEEVEIPADMMDAVEAAHVEMIEAAAEADDELIVKYLDGEELTPDEVRRGLYKGVKNAVITPVYCGSATELIGLDRLMKSVIRYTPAPDEHPVAGTSRGEEVEVHSETDGPVAGAVFKTIIDRYVGRINYVRVFSGTLRKDDHLLVPRTGNVMRIANLMTACGKEMEGADELVAGDIGVVTKLDEVITGDTLTDREQPLEIAFPEYPHPLYAVAVAPATQADSAKMGQSLHALTEEDPTIQVANVSATRQTVLQGMGDTHVDVSLRRLESKFGVSVDATLPRVPYQETISRSGTAQYRHKKQSGGAGQFAEVHLRVEPQSRGEGFEYASEVFGGAISNVFIPSIEKGVRQVMEQGVVAGFPVVDVKAVVFDGKEHPVDSKDIAFQTAGREAFKLAMQSADPQLLEPVYLVKVTVPEEYMGDVMSDFNTRRGRVQGMEQQGHRSIVSALVPYSEILRYGTDLRSMTQGRGLYSITFDHYDPVPAHLTEQIVSQIQHENGSE